MEQPDLFGTISQPPSSPVSANDSADNFLSEWERDEAAFAKTLGCQLTTLPKPTRRGGKSRVKYVLADPDGAEAYFGSMYAVSRRLGKIRRARAA